MNLLALQKAEALHRLAQLDAELEAWANLSVENQPFEKHQRQIKAFSGLIRHVRTQVQALLEDRTLDLAGTREASRALLGLFRIWEFLRHKLALRLEKRYSDYLKLADEFAWDCYQPIYAQGFKEPPLVFLNGGYSPFILTRDESIEAEVVPQELIHDRSLLAVMRSLPFPVIGVPWYQLDQLSELTVLGHEIGHSVEADLDLETPLKRILTDTITAPDRRGQWLSWRSEIFADLYGCLCGGPVFVAALARFLSLENPLSEVPGYPPLGIRFGWNLAVLSALGFKEEARSLDADWAPLFPVSPGASEFVEADAEPVAKAILAHAPGGILPLSDLRPLTPARYDQGVRAGRKLLLREMPPFTKSAVTFAVAAGLVHDPTLLGPEFSPPSPSDRDEFLTTVRTAWLGSIEAGTRARLPGADPDTLAARRTPVVAERETFWSVALLATRATRPLATPHSDS